MSNHPSDQVTLFEPDDEAAFFLPSTEVSKRYTAAHAAAVEWKRNLILMCVVSGWPIEQIARAAHVSTRTVLALAARESEKVAGNIKEFGKALHTLGARWYGLARAKEGEASFIQLAQAASFAVQRGSEVLTAGLTGESGGENAQPIEVEAESLAGQVLEWAGVRTPVTVSAAGAPAAPSCAREMIEARHTEATTERREANPQQIEATCHGAAACAAVQPTIETPNQGPSIHQATSPTDLANAAVEIEDELSHAPGQEAGGGSSAPGGGGSSMGGNAGGFMAKAPFKPVPSAAHLEPPDAQPAPDGPKVKKSAPDAAQRADRTAL